VRTFSTPFASHLASQVTTLALMVKITRADGVVFGFTSLDVPLALEGLTYMPTDSLSPTALESSPDMAADNVDVVGLLTDDRITDDDLLGGKYDGATVDVFKINYLAPPSSLSDTGNVWYLLRATIGNIQINGQTFTAELRSLKDFFQRDFMEMYQPLCRAQQLGDARCKVDTAPITFSYTVTSVTDFKTFVHSGTAQANGYFNYGILKWTGGVNAGQEVVVKTYQADRLVALVDPMFFGITVGDTFRMTRGCDRRFETCRNVFNNVKNFRGEPPHLLGGMDKLANPTDRLS
jgi:uncharacterized phage protein (TIGR02218 family)